MSPLEDDRVRLRELRDSDLEQLVAWWQDPGVAVTQSPGPLHPRPGAVVAEQFRSWSGNQGTDAGLVVAERTAGTLLGHVSLFGANAHSRTANFAIVIGPPHQNKGYGTAATRLMLRYAFEELGLHRVQLRVNASNERGLRAYEKAGFVREGRLRECVFRGGRWQDDIPMGILAREWFAA